ncbi:cysteine--tRNA ligase [uncultured Tateyamaria sp.]|uniref:cysteine--tRNA ligase n=1 Tax=uncultured Tateyamaria sp. TaxID=455651 RepID=UPI002609ED73|nr:cysteine--tRNA ligase [uncultured Tateyamaria sp.]
MTIQLHNTATRRKEAFAPIDPDNVRMYVCGPTVYDRAHLGNARPVLVFDVLFRLLRHVYGEGAVTYVRNFTDVDDKINATALARKEAGAPGTLEELVAERSDETIEWYHADMDALGALRPTKEPRATQYIAQMVAMIEDLMGKGFAYAKDGHVLFRVREYDKYGALSGRSVDDMIAGARVEVAPYKEDPMDFVLWKPSDDDLPGWDSPWGRGRPGWHIECSAMAYELLGNTFDIHGGGNDLQFPHHENEIAQSKCAGHGFARYWLHNEMLQVEGKKMSKSLGNFFTVRDLLDQGVPGEVIRFVMLSTHYRKPMDWTEKKRAEADAHFRRWKPYLQGREGSKVVDDRIVAALSNDLNTPLAISVLHQLYKEGSKDSYEKMAASLRFMGINPDFPWIDSDNAEPNIGYGLTSEDRKHISKVYERWHNLVRQAKAANGPEKQELFAQSDSIRKVMNEAGVNLSIWSQATSGEEAVDDMRFDPEKVREVYVGFK